MPHTTQYLVEQTIRTHEIDETGDATLLTFITETLHDTHTVQCSLSLNALLYNYLIWANGEGLEPVEPE